MEGILQCPVCRRPNSGQGDEACPKCGFPLAYASRFLGRASYDAWLHHVKEARTSRFRQIQQGFAGKGRFAMTGHSVSLILPSGTVYSVGEQTEGITVPVKQVSASESHVLYLRTDGTVIAKGSNDQGQCQVDGSQNVSFVLASPQCSYVISDGRVFSRGVCLFYKEIAAWREVVSLAGGARHLLGLRADGRVLQAAERSFVKGPCSAAQWLDLQRVAASGNCSFGLTKEGRVLFDGPKNDARAGVEAWRGVIDIAAESRYVVGLTEDGSILLAGSVSPMLDMGRSQAAEWKEVIAITCGRAAIGALLRDGSICLAGNIADARQLCRQWKPPHPEGDIC